MPPQHPKHARVRLPARILVRTRDWEGSEETEGIKKKENGEPHAIPLARHISQRTGRRKHGGSIAEEAIQMSVDISSVFDLTPSEKLQLVEDLWDDLAATPDAVPVHDWQLEELARRKARLAANPASGLSWEEVKRRVRSRYGR
jgi:putative addiction module component (TIGR02574 family)